MKNFNELVPLCKIQLALGEINKNDLEYKIYENLFSNVIFSKYISKDIKQYILLDMACSKSYVKECIGNNSNISYVGLDNVVEFNKDGQLLKPDIISEMNDIPVKDKSCDFIFSKGERLGYGKNHKSLFEIERIIKSNGYLIVALSKFWYNVGFNQMLFCYRDWKYEEAVELSYSFIDKINDVSKQVITSKYFLIYKYVGK